VEWLPLKPAALSSAASCLALSSSSDLSIEALNFLAAFSSSLTVLIYLNLDSKIAFSAASFLLSIISLVFSSRVGSSSSLRFFSASAASFLSLAASICFLVFSALASYFFSFAAAF